ncbi:hypothetical protein PIB30_002946 [Stylosanthes scabra]|uniref:Uncharacterized protein n=1 Tax=Stylosanthes scabra TaxID=79078 RepID=A0ABU6V292_9FABA|nr:hypothetical protein [Stylosanthes scabra]
MEQIGSVEEYFTNFLPYAQRNFKTRVSNPEQFINTVAECINNYRSNKFLQHLNNFRIIKNSSKSKYSDPTTFSNKIQDETTIPYPEFQAKNEVQCSKSTEHKTPTLSLEILTEREEEVATDLAASAEGFTKILDLTVESDLTKEGEAILGDGTTPGEDHERPVTSNGTEDGAVLKGKVESTDVELAETGATRPPPKPPDMISSTMAEDELEMVMAEARVAGEATDWHLGSGAEDGAVATVTDGGLIKRLLRWFILLTPPPLLAAVFLWDRESTFETKKKQDAMILKKVVGATDGADVSGNRGGQRAPWLAAVVADSRKKKEEPAADVALGIGKGVLFLSLNENEGETWTPNLEVGLHYMPKAQREFL